MVYLLGLPLFSSYSYSYPTPSKEYSAFLYSPHLPIMVWARSPPYVIRPHSDFIGDIAFDSICLFCILLLSILGRSSFQFPTIAIFATEHLLNFDPLGSPLVDRFVPVTRFIIARDYINFSCRLAIFSKFTASRCQVARPLVVVYPSSSCPFFLYRWCWFIHCFAYLPYYSCF